MLTRMICRSCSTAEREASKAKEVAVLKAEEGVGFEARAVVLAEVATADGAPCAQPLADLTAESATAPAAEPTARSTSSSAAATQQPSLYDEFYNA